MSEPFFFCNLVTFARLLICFCSLWCQTVGCTYFLKGILRFSACPALVQKRKRPTLANPVLAIPEFDQFWPVQFWPIHFLAIVVQSQFLAKANFGQSQFLANPIFGQSIFLVSWWGPEKGGGQTQKKVWAPKGGAPKLWPEGVGPRRVWGPPRVGSPNGGGPKISRFFSLSRHSLLFFPSLVSLFRGIFGGVWSAGALKCARLEFSGCRVKPRRPPKPETTTTTQHPNNTHQQHSTQQTHSKQTQNNTQKTQQHTTTQTSKKTNNTETTPKTNHNNTKKNGLAKNWIGQNWIGQNWPNH